MKKARNQGNFITYISTKIRLHDILEKKSFKEFGRGWRRKFQMDFPAMDRNL